MTLALQLLTIPEAAARLRCSRHHVYRLINAGDLRVVELRATGKQPKSRVRSDDLHDFINDRTQASVRGGGTT